ncbi:MAG: hypothetical protein HC801_11560 [Nitrospira sp.]|nr:hypothetical protein [Nitrospira sp.]
MKVDKDRKNFMLRIRMTSADRAIIHNAAEADGREISTWARETLLRMARRKLTTIRTKWTKGDSA